MRILAPLSLSVLLAACATAPKPVEPGEIPQSSHTRGEIIGMTAEETVRRFGSPELQIREGDSLKLQWRTAHCVLDAYLYATGNAPHRVTYVDARTRALQDVDPAACIRSLDAP